MNNINLLKVVILKKFRIEQKCEEIINRVNVLKEHLLMKVVDEKAEKERLITSQMKQFLNLEVNHPICQSQF